MSVTLYVIICVLCVVIRSYALSLGPTHRHCVLPIFVGSSCRRWALYFDVGSYIGSYMPSSGPTIVVGVISWAMGSIVLVSYLPQLISSRPCLLPACSRWPVMLYWLHCHCFPLLPPPPCCYVVPPVLLIIFAWHHSAHIDGHDEPYYTHHNMANFLVGLPCRYECCVGFEHR